LSANADPAPVASVCICTLARPKGLSRLLAALAQQIGAPPFEVIVVDNDASGTAVDVVEPFRRQLRLSYFVQPLRGLTHSRNMAVERSIGAYVAFIDDDEWPRPDWLANLHRMATNRAADAVFGPVLVQFADGVPSHIQGCSLFTHQLPEHGASVPWQTTRTSNAYVRRAALPDPSRPFRDAFNLTGGEDCDLFKRMLDNGAVAVAAADAARMFLLNLSVWRDWGNDVYGEQTVTRIERSLAAIEAGDVDAEITWQLRQVAVSRLSGACAGRGGFPGPACGSRWR